MTSSKPQPATLSAITGAPAVLLRIGGLPVERMDELCSPDVSAEAEACLSIDSKLRGWSGVLVDRLHSEIGRVRDIAVQRSLLRIKRDVFNQRRLTVSPEQFNAHLSEQLRSELTAWDLRVAQLNDRFARGEELCAAEVLDKRRRLKQSALDPDFRKGLLLSSPVFERTLDKYIALPDPVNLDRKMRRTEQSLLLYASRTCYKTTPFSTLTPVCYAFFEDGSPLTPSCLKGEVRSSVQPNMGLCARLVEALQKQASSIPSLPIRLKEAWICEGNRIRYLRRVVTPLRRGGPLHSSISEFLFWIPTSPTLDVLLAAFNQKPVLTVQELEDTVSRECGVDSAEAQRLIALLCDMDFLVVDGLRRSTLDENFWSESARLWAGFEDPQIAGISDILISIGALASQYAVASVNQRRGLLLEMERHAAEALHRLGSPESAPLPLVYEDSTIGGAPLPLGRQAWDSLLADFARVQTLLPMFDSLLISQLALVALFKKMYASGGKCHDVFSFAEFFNGIYYRPFQEAAAEALSLRTDETSTEAPGIPNPFDLPEVTAIDEARRQLWTYLSDRLERKRGSAEIVIEDSFVEELAAMLPEPRPPLSSSFFCQLALQKPEPLLVLNQVYTGLGSMYSRFTRLFSETGLPLAQGLQIYLRSFARPGEVFAEIQGGHANNLNLHPLLTDLELLCPGEQPRCAAKAVSLSELLIYHDPETDRLRLRCERLGCDIVPLYLGFLLPMVLPELQQILLHFSPATFLRPQFWPPFAGLVPDDCAASKQPRIRCGRVVLERARWNVATDRIPKPAGGTEFRHLTSLKRWRQQNGIPDQVFITPKADTDTELDAVPEQSKTDSAGLLQKPMFLDFNNILGVRLFDRIVEEAGKTLVLTEVLPAKDDLWLRRGENAYISEFVIEVCQERR